MADLVDDLSSLEVAAKAEFAGGAERAANGTAGLARDAECVPLAVQGPAPAVISARRIVHHHRFHERPTREPVEGLLRQATVRNGDLVRLDRVDPEGFRDGFLKRCGQAA